MQKFLNELNQINNFETLQSMKEQLKNQVVEKELSWQLRMELYDKIQSINERIQEMQKKD